MVIDTLADGRLGVDVGILLPDIILGVDVDMLSDVMIRVGVDMGITVLTTPTIILLELEVRAAYTVDVLTVIMIGVVTVIDVDENVNGLAAVMTLLEFTLTAP